MIISNDIDPRTAQAKRLYDHKRKRLIACGQIKKTRTGKEIWIRGSRP
ncbi:MAG: hypothetical protein GX556_16415 [Fibrobacter sp.]|jgi:hypothetical protein|nr:hypothetical protein [Fibrobacter sp.]